MRFRRGKWLIDGPRWVPHDKSDKMSWALVLGTIARELWRINAEQAFAL
jgi:hypothetical protein